MNAITIVLESTARPAIMIMKGSNFKDKWGGRALTRNLFNEVQFVQAVVSNHTGSGAEH